MRYQIVTKERALGSRWSFVAHGATYGREEAREAKATREARGLRVMLLPVTGEAS